MTSSTENLWAAKLGYFALYGGYACFKPFWSILLTQRDFSSSLIGALTAVQPTAKLILLPPISLYADRTRTSMQISVAAIGLSCIAAMVMTVAVPKFMVGAACVVLMIAMTPIAPFFDDHTMSLLRGDSAADQNDQQQLKNTAAAANGKDQQKTPKTTPEEGEADSAKGKADANALWGNVRVYGSYGWGLAAPAASYIWGHYGWWTSSAGFTLFLAVLAYCMYVSHEYVKNKEPTKKDYAAVVKIIAGDRGIMAFLFGACFMGFGYALISTFLFIYLKEDLQAPDVLLGLSISLTVAVEIPFMTMSGRLHNALTDVQLFTLAGVGWAIRAFGYSMLTNPWYVLFLEPLHGFSFALMWLSCVHFFSNAFPKDLGATAFGLLHSSSFGVGPILGNVIGGQMYQRWGPRVMYQRMSVDMLILVGVFLLMIRGRGANGEKQQNSSQLESIVSPSPSSNVREEAMRHHEVELEQIGRAHV